MNSKLRTCSSDISEVPVLHEASHPGVQEAGLLPPSRSTWLVSFTGQLTQVYEVPVRETLLPVVEVQQQGSQLPLQLVDGDTQQLGS